MIQSSRLTIRDSLKPFINHLRSDVIYWKTGTDIIDGVPHQKYSYFEITLSNEIVEKTVSVLSEQEFVYHYILNKKL